MKDSSNFEETKSISEIYKVLKERINFILLITICAVTVMGFMNLFVLDPVYQSTAQILVNQPTSTDNPYDTGEIQTSVQLIETYSVIMESPIVLEQVVESVGGDETVSSLQDAITVTSEENSLVINLTVNHADPEMAAEIANTTAEIFQSEIVEIMQVENVTILSPASVGEKIKPNAFVNTILAACIGIVVGILVVMLREFLDTTIKNEETITEMFEIPVLGTISDFERMDENPKKR